MAERRHKEDPRTYEQIEHRTHLLAPILSRKEAFGSPRGPHQNLSSPILSKKTQRVPSELAADAVTTKPGGGSGRIFHLLGL